jgi:hypothetical protein
MIIYNIQSHILGFKIGYMFTMGMMNSTRKERILNSDGKYVDKIYQ